MNPVHASLSLEGSGRTYKEHLHWRNARAKWSPDADRRYPTAGLLGVVCAGYVSQVSPHRCLPCGRSCGHVWAANQPVEVMHPFAVQPLSPASGGG
jgi:hypothetical protein